MLIYRLFKGIGSYDSADCFYRSKQSKKDSFSNLHYEMTRLPQGVSHTHKENESDSIEQDSMMIGIIIIV